MNQLSALDAAFLHLETPEMPMHVGALHIIELPVGYRGSFVVALRRHIESRLPIAPGLRRKLAPLPLNLVNPAWVSAVPDMKEHIVSVKLQAPPGSRGGAGLARGWTRRLWRGILLGERRWWHARPALRLLDAGRRGAERDDHPHARARGGAHREVPDGT